MRSFVRILQSFALLFVVTIATSSFATPTAELMKFILTEMEKFNKELEKPYLTPDDIAKIKTILSSPSISELDKPRLCFEVEMNARIRIMASPFRERAVEVIGQRAWLFKNEPIAKAGVVPYIHEGKYLPIVQIALSNKYNESWLHYYLLRHEVEHTLQFIYILGLAEQRGYYGQDVLSVGHNEGDVSSLPVYLREKGAMIAEWNMLQIIPDAELQKIIQEIDSDPYFESSENEDMQFKLLNALSKKHLSVLEYLSAQYDMGQGQRRYANRFALSFDDYLKRTGQSYIPFHLQLLNDATIVQNIFQGIPDSRRAFLIYESFQEDGRQFPLLNIEAMKYVDKISADGISKFLAATGDLQGFPDEIYLKWLDIALNSPDVSKDYKAGIKVQHSSILAKQNRSGECISFDVK